MNNTPVKNVDYVASRPDGLDWWFTIEPTTVAGDGFVDKLLVITQSALDVFDGFVVPTEVTYAAGTKPVGISDWTKMMSTGDVECNTIRSSNGVTYSDLEHEIASIDVPDGQELYASLVEFTNSRTKVFLREGDAWIDTESEGTYKSYSRGEVSGTPSGPLLSLSITHMDKSYSEATQNDESHNTIYVLRIESASDIWVGDSPVERVNQNRLRIAFNAILDRFEVIEMKCTSDFAEYIDEDAAAVVFDEIEDENELLEVAREWLAE